MSADPLQQVEEEIRELADTITLMSRRRARTELRRLACLVAARRTSAAAPVPRRARPPEIFEHSLDAFLARIKEMPA